MDVEKSIYKILHRELTASEELKSVMGNAPRLFPVLAPPDTKFPYINYLVRMSRGEDIVMAPANIRLDVWDFSENVVRSLDVRKAVMDVLDLTILYDEEDMTGVRFEFQDGGFIGTDEASIWRYEMLFSLRLVRKSELEAMLQRRK